MTGHRARVLLEWYSADAPEAEMVAFTEEVEAMLAGRYPQATTISYVESNPPRDEVS